MARSPARNGTAHEVSSDTQMASRAVDVTKVYGQGHLPGAVLWNAYTDLRDATYRPVGRADLERLLSRSGIAPESAVVVYGYSAPLGFWLLKTYGHRDVRILAESRNRWTEAGNAWTTNVSEPAEVPVGVYLTWPCVALTIDTVPRVAPETAVTLKPLKKVLSLVRTFNVVARPTGAVTKSGFAVGGSTATRFPQFKAEFDPDE